MLVLNKLNYSASQLKLVVYSSIGAIEYDEIKMILPHLIVIGYWLNFNAGDLCYKIKSDEVTNTTPVIMLSPTAKIKKIARENCADAYLPAPLNECDLAKTIRRFI